MEDEKEFINAVRLLYYWQHSNTGSFSNCLFDLYVKADYINKEKIERGFPAEVKAYRAWCEAGDNGNDLFRQHGLI